jgi:hypothetical protein
MAPRSAGKVFLGTATLLAGGFVVWAALTRADAFPPKMGPLSMVFVLEVIGATLGACGLVVIVGGLRKRDEPEASIPAHVAFLNRNSTPLVAPPKNVKANERYVPDLDPHQRALMRVDTEIRELTKRINKAGVMLATGKLSREGYAAYVDELKRQRSNLETDRVHMEMRKH